MPISYILDRERGQLHTKVEGPVTVNDILAHLDAVLRDEALPYVELIDARGAARPFLSATDIWRAASTVQNMEFAAPIGPRAVILRDDVTFGLARIFTNLVSGHFPIEAFRDQAKAEEWLAGWTRAPQAD
jgi:hypothetical protein